MEIRRVTVVRRPEGTEELAPNFDATQPYKDHALPPVPDVSYGGVKELSDDIRLLEREELDTPLFYC